MENSINKRDRQTEREKENRERIKTIIIGMLKEREKRIEEKRRKKIRATKALLMIVIPDNY